MTRDTIYFDVLRHELPQLGRPELAADRYLWAFLSTIEGLHFVLTNQTLYVSSGPSGGSALTHHSIPSDSAPAIRWDIVLEVLTAHLAACGTGLHSAKAMAETALRDFCRGPVPTRNLEAAALHAEFLRRFWGSAPNGG